MASFDAQFDAVDRQILEILQVDARINMRALGQRVGLSSPAVTERVRRLEASRVIRGYRAEIVPERIGLPVVAFVTLALSADGRGPLRVESEAHKLDSVVECYRVTGEDAFLMKLAARDLESLRETLDRLSELGRVRTAIVLGVSKSGTSLHPPAPQRPPPRFWHGAD